MSESIRQDVVRVTDEFRKGDRIRVYGRERLWLRLVNRLLRRLGRTALDPQSKCYLVVDVEPKSRCEGTLVVEKLPVPWWRRLPTKRRTP